MTDIRGQVAPGFEAVADAFESNFTEHGDVGAGFSLFVDGEEVVSLTGGVADADGRPYDEDTLQLVFSTTKGATAVCAHLLVERGLLDLDAPVVDYWPEFAASGKEQVPVRWLLTHETGLVDTERRMSLDEALDWDTVTEALAESTPLWEPGTQHGYHAITYGWLVGEIVRRVSGRSIGEFFAEEVAEPLGLDFWIGLPESEQHRVAPLIPMSAVPEPMMLAEEGPGSDDAPMSLIAMLEQFLGPDNLVGRALTAPGGAFAEEQVWNESRVWSAQIPAANGITNATSLARMYSSLVAETDGVRTLQPETVDRAIVPQVSGPDSVLIFPIPFALGFMTHSDMSPFLGGRSFGHGGAGGSLGFADPDRRIGGGYVMNKMHMGLTGDPRNIALLDAVDRSVT